MRAHEFITEVQERRPEISLRHLNHLKHINRARAASHARQAALKRTMYASPAREHERIELEKVRRVLEQGGFVVRDREVGDVTRLNRPPRRGGIPAPLRPSYQKCRNQTLGCHGRTCRLPTH